MRSTRVLTANSNHSFIVAQTAQINVKSEEITATFDVNIQGYLVQTGGDPASNLLSTPAAGEQALNSSAVTTYEAKNEQPGVLPSISGQTIEITAAYVDINGDIQAGYATPTLVLNDSDSTTDIDAQIAAIIAAGLTTPQQLTLSTTDDPNNAFKVFYDPSSGSIEVEPVAVGGGSVTIKGAIESTANATISALGYYGDVNITNNTHYNLIVDGVNASQEGGGIVDITDFNLTDGVQNAQGNYYALETTYLTQSNGSVWTRAQYVDPTSGALQPGTTPSYTYPKANSNGLYTYQPEVGQQFTFTVEWGTETQTDITYWSSSWLGVFSLGSGANADPPIVTQIGTPQILGSSLNYYLDTSVNSAYLSTGTDNNPLYSYSNYSITTADSGSQPISNWSTSTWYGKKTYYQEQQDTAKQDNYGIHSIAADLPVSIDFTGNQSAAVDITSDTSVTLAGSIEAAGSISITTGGSLTAAAGVTIGASDQLVTQVTVASGTVNSSVTVGPSSNPIPTTVSLTANGGDIGSASTPIVVLLAGTASDEVNATAAGSIYIDLPSGALPVGAITSKGGGRCRSPPRDRF